MGSRKTKFLKQAIQVMNCFKLIHRPNPFLNSFSLSQRNNRALKQTTANRRAKNKIIFESIQSVKLGYSDNISLG